ncbi:hypothetical protein HYPSUDRAFT_204279 [Hypholoma sublateritium FD-334 SS-4]|uniref:DUF6534 domain-containing protein n=1 Tax=Hypholoma sublateritium (strain FD-334 SS-4) TaxID=945553 RepID=A0A0D2KZF1_HYPSF|nr:hypothetical protein HYPSUDRAFT_204279 [Hypholoma sublateritium FD-334 SS-4]
MANWILYGILSVQFYLYYIAFPKDPHVLKLIVFAQLLLETTQTATSTYDLIHHVTEAYTNPNAINEVGTIWISIPLMIGLIASVTQWFYCYRVGVLTRSKFAVALISLLSLGQLAAAIAVAIQEKDAVLLTRLLSQKSTMTAIGIWGSCSFACDIVIAAIMTYYLKKGDTGFENTHNMIVRLIRLSIESGCVTAFSAGVLVVLVFLPGPPPYYAAAAAVVGKAYSNSMMAMLNSRVKPVSNAPALEAPSWNESVKPSAPDSSTGGTEGFVFRGRDSEVGFDSSASEFPPPGELATSPRAYALGNAYRRRPPAHAPIRNGVFARLHALYAALTAEYAEHHAYAGRSRSTRSTPRCCLHAQPRTGCALAV